MKKTKKELRTKSQSHRKTSPAAKALGKVILADLAEFAQHLEAGIALDSKYTIRRVEIRETPAT